jgi:hemerythrin-like domain-containing protein
MLRDPGLVPLSHQHHNGLALCVLIRRSLAADTSADNVARLAGRAIDRYELELVNHFDLEERVLFAEAERHMGPQDSIAELIAEHRRIEQMIAEMRAAPSAGVLERFCALLSAHIRREENELFQEIQQRLPREALDRIGEILQEKAVRICL